MYPYRLVLWKLIVILNRLVFLGEQSGMQPYDLEQLANAALGDYI